MNIKLKLTPLKTSLNKKILSVLTPFNLNKTPNMKCLKKIEYNRTRTEVKQKL